ncbi:hypothetical protein OPV22_007938 [Ensete ventricosum]|uniref:HMA domain-containing protein n=1 Tax=Ensete ventricosum TaxID=4639 RepID=A0AAV8R5H9_ENSVE|nr:hypothetical protein OPV22_007938 [Ensete ventricosum]
MSKKNDSGGDKKNSATGHSHQGKKDDGAITVVYKVGMYCQGCVDKVVRSVKCFPGVQEVNTELESSKLTVVGKMDPWKLRDRVEAKTQKKVDLVSPIKKPDAAADQKPVGDKAKEHKATTVVLKISLYCHCRGCIRGIVDTIRRIEGVHDVSIDAQNELVTVTGTMDAKAVTKISSHNMVREVKAVVQPKKDDGGGKKKKGGGGEGGSEGANEEHAATPAAVAEASRMEWYYHRMHHAPQLFSDENPNACSIS